MAKRKTKTKTKDIEAVQSLDQVIETVEQKETRQTTLIEKYGLDKDQTIAIRPYFDPNFENMGLENYGMTLHEGVYHVEEMSCLEVNGVKRYVTGLNEFAPEVKMLPPKEKEARVGQIRGAVAQLEAELASNIIDPKDPDFWNNVRLLKPDNDTLWSKITLKLSNEPVYLDPKTDPYDLIKIFSIQAGGFSMVAKNLNEAKTDDKKKFYLDKIEETANTRTEGTKLRNRALASLQNLYDTNSTKLFYVAKVIDVGSSQYVHSTPNDIIYENMDDYIIGQGQEILTSAAKNFLKVSRDNLQTLKITALVKDANFYNFLTSEQGFIKDAMSGTKLGRTTEQVIEYLMDPLNEEILNNLLMKVEKYWNS